MSAPHSSLKSFFEAIHAESVRTEDDFKRVLQDFNDESTGYSLTRLYRCAVRIDSSLDAADAASVLSEVSDSRAHTYIGPIILRATELIGSLPDETARLSEVLSSFDAYAAGVSGVGIKRFAVLAASGTFAYLAHTKSPLLEQFADTVLARVSTNPSMVRAILCPSESAERTDTTEMLDQLRKSMERQGGVDHWIRSNINSRHRVLLYKLTQWPEAVGTMTKKSRGRMLEDDLGM